MIIILIHHSESLHVFISAVDCGDLSAPDNGFIAINSTTFTSTASYSCATGHELVGNDTRTCVESGNWSGNQPQCGGDYRSVNLHLRHNYYL